MWFSIRAGASLFRTRHSLSLADRLCGEIWHGNMTQVLGSAIHAYASGHGGWRFGRRRIAEGTYA